MKPSSKLKESSQLNYVIMVLLPLTYCFMFRTPRRQCSRGQQAFHFAPFLKSKGGKESRYKGDRRVLLVVVEGWWYPKLTDVQYKTNCCLTLPCMSPCPLICKSPSTPRACNISRFTEMCEVVVLDV